MCCMYTVYSGMQEWVIQIPSIPILVSVLFPSLWNMEWNITAIWQGLELAQRKMHSKELEGQVSDLLADFKVETSAVYKREGRVWL